MQILSNPIYALNVCESPKFLRLLGIGVEECDGDISFETGSGNTAVSRMCNEKCAI